MASRPLILATLVGASIGASYLGSNSTTGKNGTTPTPNTTNSFYSATTQTTQATRLPAVGTPVATGTPIANGSTVGLNNASTNSPGLSGNMTRSTLFTSVAQVLRFDVNKEWVYRNWDRKTTGPTDVGLFAVRVPLVMAPRMNAMAGALTYYFNVNDQVEHISFHGRTADTTELVQLLTTTYHFERAAAPTGEQVYQVLYDGQVQSELRTHPEAVLWSNSPNQSIAVELELARPGSERVLPPRPTGFQIPQGAPPVTQSNSSAAAASPPQPSASATSSSGSFFDKFRHATPQEQTPLVSNRWPQ